MKRSGALRAKTAAIALVLTTLSASAAFAESCSSSRDHLLGGLAGELPQAPQSYKSLFDICIATTGLFNVKDAYVMKDGAIGVVAKQDGITITASMLSDFCQRFPNSTLRFITRNDLAKARTIPLVVLLSSTSSTPCRKIRGMPDR